MMSNHTPDFHFTGLKNLCVCVYFVVEHKVASNGLVDMFPQGTD